MESSLLSYVTGKTDWLAEMFELDKYVDEITARFIQKDFFKAFKDKHVVISSAYHNVHNVGRII